MRITTRKIIKSGELITASPKLNFDFFRKYARIELGSSDLTVQLQHFHRNKNGSLHLDSGQFLRSLMTQKTDIPRQEDPSFRPILRSIALEIIIYIPLAAIYTLVVLALAKDTLLQIYYEMPTLYAIVTLLAILAQGVLLEAFTSWILRKVGLRA